MTELASLVTAVQVADLLGVTRQRVHQLTAQEDFPEPKGRVGSHGTRLWDRTEIVSWREARKARLQGETGE